MVVMATNNEQCDFTDSEFPVGWWLNTFLFQRPRIMLYLMKWEIFFLCYRLCSQVLYSVDRAVIRGLYFVSKFTTHNHTTVCTPMQHTGEKNCDLKVVLKECDG